MLDVFDFDEEKGGDPKKIRESQRRRHAPEASVDDVIALYEDHKRSMASVFHVTYFVFRCSYYRSSVCSNSDLVKNQCNPKRNRSEKEGPLP